MKWLPLAEGFLPELAKADETPLRRQPPQSVNFACKLLSRGQSCSMPILSIPFDTLYFAGDLVSVDTRSLR